MSWDEHHVGKLKRINLDKDELNIYCKQILLEFGIINEDFNINECPYHDNYIEMLADDLSDEYFWINNKLYKKIEDHEEESGYYTKLYENDDGTISFDSNFYNGSTCLTEELEEALIKLDW